MSQYLMSLNNKYCHKVSGIRIWKTEKYITTCIMYTIGYN